MDRLVLNTPRYKGEYDFDLETEPLTNLEWRWIKKISGYMPLTIDEGWRGGDPDLFVAFAVVCLHRAGRIQKHEALTVADVLADAPFDGAAITIVGGSVEPDPPQTAAAEHPGPPLRSIGGSSSSTSDPLAPPPSPIGAPA